MRLEGRVVVITGAGNGIGRACAHRFRADGAKLVLVDINQDAVDAVAEATGSIGVAADISLEESVGLVVDRARSAVGEIDVWFSNAGISSPRRPGRIPGNDEWERMWKLHVMSHVYAARAVVPSMVARGDGYLLQTVSRVALAAHPGKAAYSVTKHASLAFGEWLAIHLPPRGIKVSCFCPGAMRTDMLLANGFTDDDPTVMAAMAPEDVADLLIDGLDREQFLILTPDACAGLLASKAADYDAWLAGFPPESRMAADQNPR